MAELEVCRICLRKDLKLYAYDKYYLKSYYEEVVAIPVGKNDLLPRFFCHECTALLYKYHRFKERCHYTRKILTDLLCKGPLNYDSFDNLDLNKLSFILHGTLDVLKISKRVKTSILKYQEKEDKPIKKNEMVKHEVMTVDYYSDQDISDNNDNNDFELDHIVQEPEVELSKIDPDTALDFEELIPVEPNKVTVEEVKLLNPKVKPKSHKELPEEENNVEEVNKYGKRVTRKRKSHCKKSIESEPPKNPSEIITEAKKYKFSKSKRGNLKSMQFLDSGFWKKTYLTEEEAIKEFEAKAQSQKYLCSPYKCTDCRKPFSQKNMLDRHIIQKHGEAAGSLVCRFCKMRFKQACILSKHMRLHYNKYECLRCNLVCNVDTTALFHEEYHNGVIRKCPHCEKGFRHLSSFYTHLRTHRSKHMCPLCGESFVSELGLKQHQRLKHIPDTENKAEDAELNTYCESCKIKFENKEAYDKHLLHSAMHAEEVTEEIPIVEFSQHDDYKAEELHKRKSKVEKTLSVFRKRNLPAVAGGGWTKKPTTCQHCGKHFDSQSACRKHHLQEHLRAPFHTASDRVICEVCGASLAPGSVNAHINQHTRSKMFTCETCGRSFTTNHVLRNHMATHTGERNYPCNVCGKRFTQNGSLNLHYRTVHLKQPYIRDRKKKTEEPNTGLFLGLGKVEFM